MGSAGQGNLLMAQNTSRPNRVDRIDLNILAALSSHAHINKVQMSNAIKKMKKRRACEPARNLSRGSPGRAAAFRYRWLRLVLTSLVACSAAAQEAAPNPGVDRTFADWSGNDRPGCALAVEKNGAVAYARGYGMADLEAGIANSPETIFDIGSVSKSLLLNCESLRQIKRSVVDDTRLLRAQLTPTRSRLNA
jgi:Beta-lactamase